MFQSLARPYFFHGSVPVWCPYFRKSWTRVSSGAERLGEASARIRG